MKGADLKVHAIDEPGIVSLDLKLPSAEEMESKDGLDASYMITCENGIIFCPASGNKPCQQWNVLSGIWSQMTTRPHEGYVISQIDVNGKRWMTGGYGLDSTLKS